jgi:hypothetical protein
MLKERHDGRLEPKHRQVARANLVRRGSLPFYAAHDVDEILIVDPAKRTVSWLELAGSQYREAPRSSLIELGPEELAERIEWPPI